MELSSLLLPFFRVCRTAQVAEPYSQLSADEAAQSGRDATSYLELFGDRLLC